MALEVFEGWGAIASAEREPITGVWGRSPPRGPEAEPLVGGQGPPEAESLLVLERPTERQNLSRCQLLPREATRSAVLPWHVVRPSVRPSVCLSVRL